MFGHPSQQPPADVIRCHNPTRVLPGDGRTVKPEVIELCGAPMRWTNSRHDGGAFAHCCVCDSAPGPRVCSLCPAVKPTEYE